MAQILGGGNTDPGDLWNNFQNIQAAGTNTLQNIGQIQQNTGMQLQNMQMKRNMQAQDVARQQMAEFNKDWQAAAGDPSALQSLAYKYPQQIEALQQRLGLTDKIRQQQGTQLASQADVALAQGPQAAQQFVRQNAPALQAMGIDPQVAYQTAEQDPEAFQRSIQALHLASNTSKDQLDYAKETMKNSTAIRGQDLDAAAKAADRNLRYIGLQDDRLNTQIAQEKNDIERQKYAQTQAKVQTDALNTKRDFLQTFDKTIAPIDNSLDLANGLLQRKDLGMVTGNLGRANRLWSTGTGGGDNTSEIMRTLDQLKSQARLAGMESLRGTGSVTEKEGEAAANALLNADPGSMSEEQLRNVITRYTNSLQKGKDALEKNQGGRVESYRREVQQDDQKQNAVSSLTSGGMPPASASAAINYLYSNPTPSVKEQFKAKYGFLPEGL